MKFIRKNLTHFFLTACNILLMILTGYCTFSGYVANTPLRLTIVLALILSITTYAMDRYYNYNERILGKIHIIVLVIGVTMIIAGGTLIVSNTKDITNISHIAILIAGVIIYGIEDYRANLIGER